MNRKILFIIIAVLFITWLGGLVFLILDSDDNYDSSAPNMVADSQEPTADSNTNNDNDNTSTGGTIKLTKSTYLSGETVEFTLNGYMIEYCSDSLPYQITDSAGENLNIKHSCIGFIGHGTDQYCENGEIVVVRTNDQCSDVLDCRSRKVSGTFTWDQKIYRSIQENCQGQTISSEEPSLVSTGTYYIIIADSNGEVTKEMFEIKPKQAEECSSDSDCAIGGCSSEVCGVKGLVESVVSPCLARPYYECYQYTSCGCVSGQCRWEDNPNFDKCFLEKGNE